MNSEANFGTVVYKDYFSRPRGWRLTRADCIVLYVTLVCLFLFALLLKNLGLGSGARSARRSDAANGILETEHWQMPRLEFGHLVQSDSIIYEWFFALSTKLFGHWFFGPDVLIFLVSVALLCLVYVFVKHHLKSDMALICCAVAASSELFFLLFSVPASDLIFALGTTLSMCAFFVAASSNGTSPIWDSCFFLGLATGLLAKGPMAVVVIGLPLLLWLLYGNFWHRVGHIQWGRGALFLAIVALASFFVAEQVTSNVPRSAVVGAHFDVPTTENRQGFARNFADVQFSGAVWLYACVAFLPWTLYAGVLFWKISDIGEQTIDDTQGWHSYLFIWAVSPILVLTPAGTFSPAHVVPALPPASILVSCLWMDYLGSLDIKMKAIFLMSVWCAPTAYLSLALWSSQ